MLTTVSPYRAGSWNTTPPVLEEQMIHGGTIYSPAEIVPASIERPINDEHNDVGFTRRTVTRGDPHDS